MTKQTEPQTIFRHDYAAPTHWIDTVELQFDLAEEQSICRNRMAIRQNPERGEAALRLDGHGFDLVSVELDGRALGKGEYKQDSESLIIDSLPTNCVLEITTALRPQDNTALEGLYKSSGTFCTQCEAEGFRRISYFLDRPDVLSRYRVTITADKTLYPVLLSNGNCLSVSDAANGKHTAVWDDPHPKPCYLFALVAGDLEHVSETYRTAEGREVALNIFTEAHNITRCDHAMRSLIHSMQWDEEVYGLSYDLDVFNIVAVDDFNMGAMENKSLNIFNSKYVLADQHTATDTDFQQIEAIIAHEYFHNWSGNRVTCRDWFQLSLKEGLTVFRDQEFSADKNSRAVKRIEDVRLLRARQFPEDAGPMAHPVRPESYIEINNFYTVTIYEKGAELIRMMYTLLGAEKYRAALDLYFQRFDGQAVTCEDFVQTLEQSSGIDLTQFRHWYSQPGTPTLSVDAKHDPEAQQLTLRFRQTIQGQEQPETMHIPVRIGLLRADGTEQQLHLAGHEQELGTETVLDIRETEQQFVFEQIDSPVLPSLLRGFSAPVILQADYSDADLAFLLSHDVDSFNRWEAAQQLYARIILRNADAYRAGEDFELPTALLEAMRLLLKDSAGDPALQAEALDIPREETVAAQRETVDIDALHAARSWLIEHSGQALRDLIYARYQSLITDQFSIDAEAIGARRLKNLCLGWLVAADADTYADLAIEQYKQASNMTDSLAALRCVVHNALPASEDLLGDFYTRWSHDPLVLDKWYNLQATSEVANVLESVKALHSHPQFNIENPNRVRSVVGAFCMANPVRFHAQDGSGYQYLAGFLAEYDAINPQTAARLCSALSNWSRYDETRQQHMKQALQSILNTPALSRDTYEIASKALGA